MVDHKVSPTTSVIPSANLLLKRRGLVFGKPFLLYRRFMDSISTHNPSLPELMDFKLFGKTIFVVNKKFRLFLASQLGK